jgi:hypothetical protein
MACLALMIAFTGCPLPDSRAAGIWQVDFDQNCNNVLDLQPGMVLRSDGTAEIYLASVYSGVWNLDGSTLTIQIVNPGKLSFTGGLSINGNQISNGTYSGEGNGCWTAVRIDI